MSGKSREMIDRNDLKAQSPPEPRTDHSIVLYDNKSCFVYGGRDEVHIFSDLFKYVIGENVWKCV